MSTLSEAAYQSGANQSVQGWIVIVVFALATFAYKRQSSEKGKSRYLGVFASRRKAPYARRRAGAEMPGAQPPPMPSYAPTVISKSPFPQRTEESPFPRMAEDRVISPDVSGDLMSRIQKDPWTRMVQEKKISGLVWTGVEDSPFGVRVKVKFEGTMNYSVALSSVHHIEAGLDVPAGSVRPKAGKTMGWGFIEIRTKTPFPDGLFWEAPTGPVRLADPVHLATTPDGEKIFLDVKQRILVTGTSGAGKSGTQSVIAAHVILAEDAELEFWDFKRVGATAFEGKAKCVTTVQEAAERIQWLMEEEYTRRMDLMIQRKVSTWAETPDDPALVLMIDEGNDLTRDLSPELKAQLFSAVEKGRALGVYFVWATQFPKGTNLPTELRSQFSAKACMRLLDIKESRVAMGDDSVSVGWSPHLLDNHWILLKDGDNKSPREARVLHLKEDVFVELGTTSRGHGDNVPGTRGQTVSLGDTSLEDNIMLCLLMSPGPMSGRALAQELGKPSMTVARAVEALVEGGKLVRGDGGLRLNSAPRGG